MGELEKVIMRLVEKYGAVMLLLAVGLLLRWVVFGTMGVSHLATNMGTPDAATFDMLENHLLDFLWYTHTKPPGIYLRDGLAFALGGRLDYNFFVFLSTALLGVLSALPIFGTLRLLGATGVLAWYAALLWSVAMIIWEYWRTGAFYDHPATFFMCFFLYGWANLFYRSDRRAVLGAALAACLLILFHAAAMLLVPLAYGLLLVLRYRREFFTQAVRMTALPLLLLFLLMAKNQVNVGVAATSSVAGQNRLQFVLMSVDAQPNLDYIETIATENNYPAWWLWCFRQARVLNTDPTVPPDVFSVYGMCLPNRDGKPDDTALREQFPQDRELLDRLDRDAEERERRPWRFLGAISESSSRFHVYYGQISQRVWGDALRRDPNPFMERVWFTKDLFLYHGARLFQGLFRESERFVLAAILLRHAVDVIRWLFYIGMAGAFLVAPLMLIRLILPWKRVDGQRNMAWLFIAIAGLFAMMTVAFSTLTCCENNRIFVAFASLPFVLGVVVCQGAWYTLERTWSALLKS